MRPDQTATVADRVRDNYCGVLAMTRLVGGGFERVGLWIGDPGSWQAYRRPDRRRVKALASSVRLGQGAERVCMCVCLCCGLWAAIFSVRAVGASVLCTRYTKQACLGWESAVIRAARRSGATCICWLALAAAGSAHLHLHLWETKELRSRRRVGQAHGLAPAC